MISDVAGRGWKSTVMNTGQEISNKMKEEIQFRRNKS